MSEEQQAEGSTSSAPIVFKKRNKNASSSSHRRVATDSPAPRNTANADAAGDGAQTVIDGTPQ